MTETEEYSHAVAHFPLGRELHLAKTCRAADRAKVVGLRKTVTTAHGLSVPVTSAARTQTPDAVVMPAINRITPEPLMQALASGEVREAGAVLRDWSDGGALAAAACVGTFVLAEAALLDGEEASTTWWLAPLFRQRSPEPSEPQSVQ